MAGSAHVDSIRDNRCGGCLTMHALAAIHTALNMYFVFLMGIGDYLGDGVEKLRKSKDNLCPVFPLSTQREIDFLNLLSRIV